ncbi:MAG: hypothetical protein ACRENW_07520 [Thermodesulfobacteriota bacterium]
MKRKLGSKFQKNLLTSVRKKKEVRLLFTHPVALSLTLSYPSYKLYRYLFYGIYTNSIFRWCTRKSVIARKIISGAAFFEPVLSLSQWDRDGNKQSDSKGNTKNEKWKLQAVTKQSLIIYDIASQRSTMTGKTVNPNTSHWLSTGSVRNPDLSRKFEMTPGVRLLHGVYTEFNEVFAMTIGSNRFAGIWGSDKRGRVVREL